VSATSQPFRKITESTLAVPSSPDVGGQHREDRRSGVDLSDVTDRREGAEIVFRARSVPCRRDVERRIADLALMEAPHPFTTTRAAGPFSS